MHVRLYMRELLQAGVSCSSSSLRGVPSRGVGLYEREAVNALNSDDGYVSRCDSVEGSKSSCKRKGKATEGAGEVKKLKVESRLLVGRLLLWNRAASSHLGAGSNSLDCLAFCDGSVAVCCTVQSLDVGLLGQHVQVNSWTFIPASKSLEKLCDAEDGSAGCDAVPRLKRTESDQNGELPGISGHKRVVSELLDCSGCLEIHSLKPLDEPSVSTTQVPDFPSLCLCPAAANARNLVLDSPLEKVGTSKPRLRVRGFLHCISPPFLIPSKTSLQHAPVIADGRAVPGPGPQKSLFKDKSGSRVQSESLSMLGFLVELRSCCHSSSCLPKYNKIAPDTLSDSQFLEQEVVDAGENGTVAIYFSGAVASWRPLLGEMLGDCIAISGLRRKMIRLGPEKKEFRIYVATRTSLVFRIGPPVVDCNSMIDEADGFDEHVTGNRLQIQPRDQFRHLRGLNGSHDAASSKNLRFRLQSRAEPDGDVLERAEQGLRSYVGKITSILMEGQLLELDDKVWLLLTHYKHTQVHGLRVGALVAVRHAHIMTLKSVVEKVLVLGACLRSHVWVVLHSVKNAGSRILQVSQSRLNRYIGSLPFAWAFWVIHVITNLECKFQGVYTDKELLGSMKHAGLIRKVLPSMMGTPDSLYRDAFKEFLLHEQFCLLGSTSASVLLSKVPPLSNFCKHVEMLWVDPISSIWHEDHTKTDDNCEPGARFCKPLVSQTSCYVRNIISSAKLGVVLLGSLKVCQSTGKLQLVDATGAFDVVVPDLRSLSNLHCVYQIARYKLVMEGEYKAPDVFAAGKSNNVSSPLSWSSLLKGSVSEKRIPQSFSYYVKFYLRYAKELVGLTWPSELQSHESEAVMDLLSASDKKSNPADAWKGKEFNIALITHKYPARRKCSLDKEKQWAFDVEVVLLPYNLLIHQDSDSCSTTLVPPLQNFDFSSSRMQGAIGSPDYVAAHQAHRLEQLGGIRTHAHGSILANSGCLIECRVCCLVEQRSGLKKSAGQPCCTMSASLVTRGCSVLTSTSGSSCASKEEHWASLSEAKLQKIVLAVNWRSIEISQVFNTGDWCLLPALQDKLLPFNPSELSFTLKRVETDAKHPLISLQWRYAVDIQLSQADTKNLQQTVSSRRGTISSYIPQYLSDSNMNMTECATETEEDTGKINLRRYSNIDTEEMGPRTLSSKPQLVDTILTLSTALGDEFRGWLACLERKLIPQILTVSEALRLSHSPTILLNSSSSLGEISDILSAVKSEASSGIFSLQGEVVAIQGKLETIECSNDFISTDDDNLKDPTCPRFSDCAQRRTTLFQLRDLNTDQLIRIQINFDKYVRPFGFGPGAVACFRRILLQRDANLLIGMPTTDVIIKSVEKRLHNLSHNSQLLSSDSLPPQEHEGCAENVTVVDILSDFICELEPRKKYLMVHCRIVSVQELELEWRISRPLSERKTSSDILSLQDDMVRDIAVKWGCFIIGRKFLQGMHLLDWIWSFRTVIRADDGSAVAECWASGDQAAKLLGLHALAGDVSSFCPSIIALAQISSHFNENEAGSGESFSQLLRSVVRRHKRVSVQGEPLQGDRGPTSWLIKGTDGDLEEREAMIVRLVLEQACQRGSKVVHCTTISEEDYISKYAEDFHRKQTLSSASTMGNSKPWQNLTWNRTQLFATKVEILNTWVGLQQLASSFDL